MYDLKGAHHRGQTRRHDAPFHDSIPLYSPTLSTVSDYLRGRIGAVDELIPLRPSAPRIIEFAML